jgi:hypothetical protein
MGQMELPLEVDFMFLMGVSHSRAFHPGVFFNAYSIILSLYGWRLLEAPWGKHFQYILWAH